MRLPFLSMLSILTVVLLIISAVSVTAMTATTLTGMIRMTLDKVPTTFEKSIGVKNNNNETVLVSFVPKEDLKPMVKFEAENITLEPGEERFVKFNLTVTEMKNYTSSIGVIFSRANVSENATEDKFGVATKIIIVPADQANASLNVDINLNGNRTNHTSSGNSTSNSSSTPGDNTGGNNLLTYVIIGSLALVSIIVISIIIIRKGAKNE